MFINGMDKKKKQSRIAVKNESYGVTSLVFKYHPQQLLYDFGHVIYLLCAYH